MVPIYTIRLIACLLLAFGLLAAVARAEPPAELPPPRSEGQELGPPTEAPLSAPVVAPPAEFIPPPLSGPVGPEPGCPGCSPALLPPPTFPGCCGAGGEICVPGRQPCHPAPMVGNFASRLFAGIHNCMCCPDPCYEGKWIPLADSAFFVESARPVTHQRFRWDSGQNLILPDRSEFFWARADGMGRGPKPRAPFKGETRLRYNDLILYNEIAVGNLGIIVATPYRSLQAEQFGHASGFGDLTTGTKTLLFDCELLQVALQFLTYVPIGNTTKGLGTGHVSLEPSLVIGLKLSPISYLQMQVSEWIPIGGDPNYQGSTLHYHLSCNHELLRILPDVPLVGTLEFNGYSFQDGAYTDPVLGSFQKSSGTTYASAGGGLRLFICDKMDLGFGAAFSLTRQHFARELYRTEFRFRF